MAQKGHSLSHTKWMCKYHIVFIPKYRRKIIYNQYRSSLGEIFHRLCQYKGVEIIEGHLMPDHVHMLVSIPPRMSVASFMGYLKGKSALMMFDKNTNLKYKFGNKHFWSEGYYVSTIGLNEATIKKYITLRDILKGKSALMMFDKHANLKYKFGNRHFWAEGYYVSTVGLNEATIKKYIQEQEKHDIALDKLSVKEYENPFRDNGK